MASAEPAKFTRFIPLKQYSVLFRLIFPTSKRRWSHSHLHLPAYGGPYGEWLGTVWIE